MTDIMMSAAQTSTSKSASHGGVGRFILKRLRTSPVDTLAVMIIGPWLLTTVSQGAWKHLTESVHQNPKYAVVRKTSVDEQARNTQAEDQRNVVKYRGKTFQQTDSKEKVDLSWLGAIPYWVPVCFIGIESILLLFQGTDYFRRRGYTPAQRHNIQTYVFFAVLPLVDMLAGDDWANPSKEQQSHRRLAYRFRLPLYLWTLFEYINSIASFKTILDFKSGLSSRSRFALFMQMGLFNGAFGINVAHELLHKNNRFENALAWALLTNVNYTHWNDEHEIGHHANVATPMDAASAREDESLFQFLPRTFVGTFKSACKLEARRLLKEEKTTAWYTPKNRVLRGMAGSALWALVLARLTRSKWAIPLFYFQGFVGALLLEIVNYIEHFGLQRRRDPVSGEYEPVDPRHSWNAPNRFSNTILFKLQRHSDHHTFPTRPYEILRNFVESPQMPCGYLGMAVLASFPPAFRWVMTPLLQAHRLEFNPDREPTEEELQTVQSLKLVTRKRIWIWTLSVFTVTTAVKFRK